MAVTGVLTGLVAALFGLLDWLAVPRRTRAREIGLLHGLGNVVVVGLFAVSALLRYEGSTWEPEPIAFVLSAVGVVLAVVTGWMGGELVERLGVGVHEGAHPDAPSSLSHRRVPARGGPAVADLGGEGDVIG